MAMIGFSGSMACGSSMNFQAAPSWIMSGTCRKASLAGFCCCGRGSRDDHGVFVERQVFRQSAGRVGGNHMRERAVETVPDRLLVPADQFFLKVADELGSLGGRRGDLGDDVLGYTGRRQIFGRRHDRFEQARVAAGECLNQDLGCLFGRDLLPSR